MILSQALVDIDRETKNSQPCSGYVATVFLRAIVEVNKRLKLLGYEEQILHPFGEYESIPKIDILRILYLWDELGGIKIKPINPFHRQIFPMSSLVFKRN